MPKMLRSSEKQHGRYQYYVVCHEALVYPSAMRTFFLIAHMFICLSASAGIYKWVDEKGNVQYSDQEHQGAEEVKLPAAVTYTPTASASSNSNKKPEKKRSYTEMSIVQPQMNETIRNNTGDVQVAINLVPGLQLGDTITIYLDGKELVKGGTQTSVTLSSIDRGSHTLRTVVFDRNGVSIISSRSVIFHLQREAVDASGDNKPKDNSEAFKQDYKQDETKEADFNKDLTKDFKKEFDKDYDSSNTYKEKGKKFNDGVPSSSKTFKSGPNTFSPNYNQKP